MKFYVTSKISENILETPEGYLVCVGVSIARTGEMVYGGDEVVDDDGKPAVQPDDENKVIIIRQPKEVFRPQTIKSFEGKPVTIFHPDELVTPETWKQVAVGIMQNIRVGKGETEGDLLADLLITDANAIELVKGGLREVSCGYEADFLELGIGRGEQKSIVGNHLALVQRGRAGSSYAINDHKGRATTMSMVEKMKSIFKKAEEDVTRLAVGDADPEEKKAPSFDEICGMVKDLGAKLDAMKPKAQDASETKPSPAAPAKMEDKKEEPAKKEEAKDEEVAPSLEARLEKLEGMVAKILESKSSEAADEDEVVEMEDGEEEESGEIVHEDEEAEVEVEAEDADEDSDKDEDKGDKKKVGDSAAEVLEEDEEDFEEVASRAEILAPGIKKDQKNLKAKAIKTAYATTDGKAAIELFTGSKPLDLKNVKFVDAMFIGVSEILKAKRVDGFARTKVRDSAVKTSVPKGAISPEKLNEMNAKHYGVK